jgi:hypothetical protein
MANKFLRSSLSLSRDEASKITPEATTVQADTAIHENYIGSMNNYDRLEAIRRDRWEKHR